jgi:DNA-binding NarL/FixJ family response regulator
MARMIQIEVPDDANAEAMLKRVMRSVTGVNVKLLGDTPVNLGEKEREVVRLVVSGMTSAQIARELNKSKKTVENQRARILDKLGLGNTAQLVVFATANGLT